MKHHISIIFLLLFSIATACSVFSVHAAHASHVNPSQAKHGKNPPPELPNNAISYGPTDPKATVLVFTDIDCHFCRKLHHDVKRLTELGIELRMYAYPREMGSKDYNTFVSVFCSENPAEALTKAMEGAALDPKTCQNPVAEHMALGQKLGVEGTPTLIYPDGMGHIGYLPPESLARAALKHATIKSTAKMNETASNETPSKETASKETATAQ